ncbi:MAG: PD-(D/E)XK nuclease family protein [Verrucomicrobiae bacterium]|nr:PD-(D/E)XK nuclease family protein [Verrucomicrobiae bacterium]
MNIRFLLGPAGSGKTWQCVKEIREELLRRPLGPPLILLAPRQATFQLERLLLADGTLPGYTRLSILSFARLADYLLAVLGGARPRMLSEEGRVMVLRALLQQHEDDLKIFKSSVRRAGFAPELSRWLRELQQQQVTPECLAKAAQALAQSPALADKLNDTARLFRAFQQWLQDHALVEAEGLLPLAAARLRQAHRQQPPLHIAGLWMDGFADLTPQEVDFLAALAPHCAQMTLAFCADKLAEEDLPPLHPQAVVMRTVRRCAEALSALVNAHPSYATLGRASGLTRFAASPALAHLERHWADSLPPAFPEATPALRLVACANPEAEVICAAREILQHVRRGGRFRELAVLTRRLDSHAAYLKRIFRRYEIPFFLDQREPMAHHPLAELTRYALRVVAFGWKNADWLGALKSGLTPIAPEQLDALENLVLELGLDGERWLNSWQNEPSEAANYESWRARLVPPFRQLRETLRRHPGGVTGGDLARGLRQLYEELGVAETLQRWAEQTTPGPAALPPAAHATVWQMVEQWLETVELALGDHRLPVAEWLPILESGLSQLSVGIIPPAMDQVLVGAVDRSRQPEIKTLILLGLNEGLFPAPPEPPLLLTEEERTQLEQQGKLPLGLSLLGRQGAERYLAYIACTRAASRLVVTRAQAGAEGQPLNPSLFYLRLQQMFPQVQEERFTGEVEPRHSLHASELLPALLAGRDWPEAHRDIIPAPLEQLKHYAPDEWLGPAMLEQLFGHTLTTSISALETYAACPFRYFVERILRAGERPLFAMDDMQRGSFLHEVLAHFHHAVCQAEKQWRDLSPAEAGELLRKVAQEVADQFNYGLMQAGVRHQFLRDSLVERLEAYVAQAVRWMSVYQLNPFRVELAFGMPEDASDKAALPAWELPLEGNKTLRLMGRIDRVDIYKPSDGSPPLAVVLDYKSREKQMEDLRLHHGLDLQLLAYLNVVHLMPEMAGAAGVNALQPLGAFYVSMLASPKPASNRAKALKEKMAEGPAFPHHGRFDAAHWRLLNAKPEQNGQCSGPVRFQFKNGGPSGKAVMDSLAFQALLEQNLQHLRNFGSRILKGDMRVDPCVIKDTSACDYCPCSAVCRIDPWRHAFRRLAAPPKAGQTANTTPA